MTGRLDSLAGLARRALFAAFSGIEDACPLAVDATAGNGHDTLLLARLAGQNGRVWAFDVQEAALVAARERLARAEEGDLTARVCFVREGHERLARVLPPEAAGRVRAATFNLGFLPGSDKQIVTRPAATLRALADLASFTAPGGIVSVHCYAGHEGGREELDAVGVFCADLPWPAWRSARYEMVNKNRNREALFLLEKTAPA